MSVDQDYPTGIRKTVEDESATICRTPSTQSATASYWDITNSRQAEREDVAPPGVGTNLKDRFVIEAMVGKGGMGTVYRACDLRKVEAQDRFPYVAIKLLNDDFRKHPEALKQLQREARKAQQLAHPNIATVFDFDRDGPHVFLVMELLQGTALDQLMKQSAGKGLPVPEVVRIVKELANALGYAHDNGVVHLDFKPANVFLQTDGRIKVIDFGIARVVKRDDASDSDQTKFDAGDLHALTPTYASCEMLEQQAPDPRDDIYALACVTYELLAGRHPFDRKAAVLARQHKLQPLRLRQLSRTQWQAILHGLAFDRESRTPCARQFVAELTQKPRARWPVVAAVVTSLAALIIAAYLVLPTNNEPRLVAGVASTALLRQTTAVEKATPEKPADPVASAFIKPQVSKVEPVVEIQEKQLAKNRAAKQAIQNEPLTDSKVVVNKASTEARLRVEFESEGLVWIRAGQFAMGSSPEEVGRYDDEGPVHRVSLSAYALGQHEVTRGDYALFVEETAYDTNAPCSLWTGQKPVVLDNGSWKNPGFLQSNYDPVVCVSWDDAQAYIKWKSRKTGKHFRLPTEAEWEYAARAGTIQSRYWGDDPNEACRFANVFDDSARRQVAGRSSSSAHGCDDKAAYTMPVGRYQANAWGLYDMLGNVWELVQDCYHASYSNAPSNGSAWATKNCDEHVARGGSWNFSPRSVRSAARVRGAVNARNNVTGFRLAMSIP